MKTLDERLDLAAQMIRAMDATVRVDGETSSTVLDAITEARAILSKLPKTADGAPVWPGMTVWELRDGHITPLDEFEATPADDKGFSSLRWYGGWNAFGRLERIYSTREAAKGAK